MVAPAPSTKKTDARTGEPIRPASLEYVSHSPAHRSAYAGLSEGTWITFGTMHYLVKIKRGESLFRETTVDTTLKPCISKRPVPKLTLFAKKKKKESKEMAACLDARVLHGPRCGTAAACSHEKYCNLGRIER